MLFGAPADISAETIIGFIEKFTKGEGKEYKLDEEVVYEDGASTTEEL